MTNVNSLDIIGVHVVVLSSDTGDIPMVCIYRLSHEVEDMPSVTEVREAQRHAIVSVKRARLRSRPDHLALALRYLRRLQAMDR